MDSASLLGKADVVARALAAHSIHWPNRVGRRLLTVALRNRIEVDIDGLRIAGAIEDRGYLLDQRRGAVEVFFAALFRSSVKPGMVVADIGAYLGYYALIAAREVGASGCVYAFEPSPRTFALLEANVRRNGCSSTVRLVNAAAASSAGAVPLFVSRWDPSSNSLFAPSPESERTVVQAVVPDDTLASERPVDVLKIDAEGAEVNVLRGLSRTIDRAPDRLVLFIECYPAGLAAAGSSEDELFRTLFDLGFQVSVIDEEHHALERVRAPIRSYANLYCVRHERPAPRARAR